MNAPSQPVRVLIVDDHPLFRDGLRRSLLDFGYVVVGEADNGQSAVDLAQRLHPDLILLDFALPDFSGFEVLRRLGKIGQPWLTLLLTANIEREEILEALRLGARGAVMKDAGSDLLMKSIQAVLGGEYWVGRDVIADYVEYLEQRPPASSITGRERQIIDLIVAGLSNHEIATRLGISDETVKRHIRNAYDKLGVSSRMELALRVVRWKPST